MQEITIRPYQPQDASALAEVFCKSIMAIDEAVFNAEIHKCLRQ